MVLSVAVISACPLHFNKQFIIYITGNGVCALLIAQRATKFAIKLNLLCGFLHPIQFRIMETSTQHKSCRCCCSRLLYSCWFCANHTIFITFTWQCKRWAVKRKMGFVLRRIAWKIVNEKHEWIATNLKQNFRELKKKNMNKSAKKKKEILKELLHARVLRS